MIKLPENMLRDEAEMRAFYESVGMSPVTIEMAIKARHKQPVEEAPAAVAKPKLARGPKRKIAAQAR
jgi:hypothetical protein